MLVTTVMKTKKNARFRDAGRALTVLAAAVLSACASTPQSEDDYVVERAQARWDALLAGDIETAYQYYSPGFRSTYSMIDLGVSQRMRRVRQTSAEYLDHSCEETRCLVNFSVSFKVAQPVPGMSDYSSASPIEDTWIKTGGEWWYLPKK